jgi:4-alpha-glucanotransferase
MDVTRSSGILLHPTSLPSPWGIGDMGPEAFRFVDFLTASGQSWWQLLPLGPTGFGNSPYMCFSAFAGNPLLISPEQLVEDGLLERNVLPKHSSLPSDHVQYSVVIKQKRKLLQQSYETFQSEASATNRQDFQNFREQHAAWLEDFALFMALKETHKGQAWNKWEEDLILRTPTVLQRRSRQLHERINFHCYVQYLFFQQWATLRRYAQSKGIHIIGDLPIYVAHDSSDVWSHPDLFFLDEKGHPLVVAGVPPDYFSYTGQRWGNPIYRWDVRAKSGFQWWIDRFKANYALVDLIRLDHFRGFESYWEIPASEPNAVNGRWVKGPGRELFTAVTTALGKLAIIAEDLGVITPEVEALRDEFGFPGMKILQMAFGHDPKAHDYRPHQYDPNCVVYTATHDHNTTVGWFTSPPGKETTQTKDEIEEERRFALKYLNSDGKEIQWDFIRLAMSSVAKLAIIPLQDILGLDSNYRMNRPGTAKGNWEWRCEKEQLTDEVSHRLRDLTGLYDRLPQTLP